MLGVLLPRLAVPRERARTIYRASSEQRAARSEKRVASSESVLPQPFRYSFVSWRLRPLPSTVLACSLHTSVRCNRPHFWLQVRPAETHFSTRLSSRFVFPKRNEFNRIEEAVFRGERETPEAEKSINRFPSPLYIPRDNDLRTK